ncbi:MAG TPA: hypothetical protein PLB78_11005, partial [Anaerolineae bacterium]|nr:hypothetical protein [Anaerolineae bacterium]
MRQSICRNLLLAAMAALLAACSTPAAGPSPSSDSGTAAWAATRSPSPTTAPSATSQPPPTATITPGTARLSLSEAVWLGRGRIVDACFTPDGQLLAVGWGNGVSLWSAETGEERWWQPTNVCLIAVDVQPQGRAVAALLQDGSVTVFDAATGGAHRFEGAAPDVYWGDIAWSPGGERIAFQGIGPGRGDPIYLLDKQSGALQEVSLSAISDSVGPHLAWSPDGTAITLAGLAGSCSVVIDVETGRKRFSLGSGNACYSPYWLAWSPDGRAIVAATGRLDLLDAQSGQAMRSLEGRVRGLPMNVGNLLVFSSDGRLLASRGGQGGHPVGWTPVVIWDVATGQVLGQLQGQSEREDRVAVGFDGDSVISLYATGEIARWPIGAGEADEVVIARLPALAPEPWLAWSADGSKLAAAGRGGLAVWDTTTALSLATFGPGLSVPALSTDGRLLAMTDTERHEEVIYNLATGAVMRTLPDASPILQGAAFSPDARLIAYGAGNRAFVAEVATGRVLSELAGYPEEQSIVRVVWSPDSSALVVASGWPNSG